MSIVLKNQTMTSILKEIEQYPFDVEILREADQINLNMRRYVNRGKNRDLKLLFCIFNAHLNLNRVADIYILGKFMNIRSKAIKDTFKVCSPFKTGYRHKKVRFDLFDYLKLYMNYIKTINSSEKEQIYHLAKTLTEKNEELEYYPRQKLAASFVIYYARINGDIEMEEEMKTLFYRPTTTLETIIKKISDIDND